MAGNGWKRIEEVFAGALELADTERVSFLDGACGADRELRAEVEALLSSSVSAAESLHRVVGASAASLATQSTSVIGRRIGPYRIERQLGEGGMGVVYVAARDDATFRRTVAIKLLQQSIASERARARFRDERQILADLDHPGIVRMLDGGTTDDGQPYIVMELVDGVPLTSYAKAEALPLAARLELVAAVCEALQYAHARQIVHRDIKPSNVLVTKDGSPKLLDFGIAKLVDPSSEREARTETGVALLTPAYASPEQARSEAVTATSDVYSLGAVLYELVAGRPPLEPTGSALEILRQICEVEPQPPSAHAEAVPRALDTVILKALAKNPARRYASVDELAADLRRCVEGRPVLARPASVGYRVTRFVRRRWVPLIVAASVATVALSVGMAQRPRVGENPPLYPDASVRLAGVWNPPVRVAIGVRFAASKRVDVPGVWHAVRVELDEFADRWTKDWEAARASTDQERDPLLFGQRLACLDTALVALQGAVDSLAHAEAEPFAAGFAGYMSLPALDDCERVEVLRAQLPAPPPERRAEIAELNREIFRARVQARSGLNNRIAGALEGGLVRLAAAATRLESLGSAVAVDALSWRAWYLLTVVRNTNPRVQTDVEQARKAIDQAIAAAERLRHDQQVAIVSAMQMELERLTTANAGVVDAAFARGEAALARAGRPALGTARLTVERAQWDLRRNAPNQAADRLTALIVNGRDADVRLIGLGEWSPHVHLVRALLRLGRYDDAIREQRAFLAFGEAVLGSNGHIVLTTRADLAKVLATAGRFAEAAQEYSRTADSLESVFGADVRELRMHALGLMLEAGLEGELRDRLMSWSDSHTSWDQVTNFGVVFGLPKYVAHGLARGDREARGTAEVGQRNLWRTYEAMWHGDLTSFRAFSKVSPDDCFAASREKLAGRDSAARAFADQLRRAHPGTGIAESCEALGLWLAGRASELRDLVQRSLPLIEALTSDYNLAEMLWLLAYAHAETGDLRAAMEPAERTLAILDQCCHGFHYFAPMTELVLARGLWETGGDRGRARALAERARDGYARLGPHREPDRHAAIRWLADHPP